MPGAWANIVRDTILVHRLQDQLSDPTLSPSQVFRFLEERHPDALAAARHAGWTDPAAARLDDYLDRLQFVTTELAGQDLLDLGVPSGPMVGKTLRELRDARLDGRVGTKGEEKALVKEAISKHGGPLAHG